MNKHIFLFLIGTFAVFSITGAGCTNLLKVDDSTSEDKAVEDNILEETSSPQEEQEQNNNLTINKAREKNPELEEYSDEIVGVAVDIHNDVRVDSDRDGLADIIERSIGTDPNSVDSDGDGYSDLEEIESGYDPRVSGQKKLTKEEETKIFQALLGEVVDILDNGIKKVIKTPEAQTEYSRLEAEQQARDSFVDSRCEEYRESLFGGLSEEIVLSKRIFYSKQKQACIFEIIRENKEEDSVSYQMVVLPQKLPIEQKFFPNVSNTDVYISMQTKITETRAKYY